jgi:hypothetical protein
MLQSLSQHSTLSKQVRTNRGRDVVVHDCLLQAIALEQLAIALRKGDCRSVSLLAEHHIRTFGAFSAAEAIKSLAPWNKAKNADVLQSAAPTKIPLCVS